MAKKRGLAANRGLDALLGSIKKEKQIAASALQDDTVVREPTVSASMLETYISEAKNKNRVPTWQAQLLIQKRLKSLLPHQ